MAVPPPPAYRVAMRTTGPLWHVVRRPFEGAGRSTAFLTTGVVIQLAVLLFLSLPWVLLTPMKAVAVVAATLLPLSVVALASPLLTREQRHRFRARLTVDIPPAPGPRNRPGPLGVPARLGIPANRRQMLYHLVVAPLFALGGTVVLALWAAGAAAVSVYLWQWPTQWLIGRWFDATGAGAVGVGGVVLLYATALLSRLLADRETAVATALLGPSREERLARRVEDLTESRAGMVDAADAERRRIERDLHDGAQQRLVSLAVTLGLARATLNDLPEEARRVLDEAHREAKEAITELGNLVRGLHPAVLEDRGLDAALSGIAARAPLPVRLRVDLPVRPSPTVEAVAYFVVSEALANVVKHARASRAEVTVGLAGGLLKVVIRDDGVGGADPAHGTGLAGLAKRAASVDGTLSLVSPAGGPTSVTVELPCAL